METQGILYIAAGKKYIQAAVQSALSVRKHCPGLPTHLYADWQNYTGFDFDRDPYPFSSVSRIPAPHRRSKVDYIGLTPFDRTLYLDTDTRLNADIREMFSTLDRFDIALAHAHRRNDIFRLTPWRIQLPGAFPQFNAGVVLYRKDPRVLAFMESWKQAFAEAGFLQDQITLRELLWLSDLRIATLPPEYNVRYLKYPLIWNRNEARPKILHLQMYHEGPFWFLKNWGKQLGRVVLRRFGIKSSDITKHLNHDR